MKKDLLSRETFSRVVGKRTRPPLGIPPSKAARDALAQMARYETRAPKGVYRYRSHEEANADMERWRVDLMVSRQSHD